MALLQSTRILPNERLDLPDFRNIEKFVCADFSAIHKNVWTNGNFVLSGFDVLSASIGTNTLQVTLAGSTCVLGLDSGTLFIGAPGLPALSTSVLTPGATNYVELTIDTDTGGADSRAFWDQTANGGKGGEFSQIVDTYSFLKANFAINTSGFTGDADKIKIAEVVVSGAGLITSVEDRRDLFFRLGRASNPSFSYSWSSRTEPASTSFSGADKDIKNLKQLLDALMDSIREIKQTSYWFEDAGVSLQGTFKQIISTLVSASSSAKISWNGTSVEITDDSVTPADSDVVAQLRIFTSTSDLKLTRQDDTDAITLDDKEVLWIEIPTSGDVTYDGLGVASTNYQVSALGALPLSDNVYWLAYREGTRLYVRDLGELEEGESIEIEDQIPDALKEFLGFDPEVATSVPYTAVPNSAIFATTFDTSDSLVKAISTLTTNLNALGATLDTNVYEEIVEVVSGEPADDNEIEGPVSSGAEITLPTDSRDEDSAEKYVVGSGILQIFLNGQALITGEDWDEVGSAGELSDKIEILQDLKIGDKLLFRIGSLGGFNAGADAGEVNTGTNVGGGKEVFKQKSGVAFEFRTMVAGSNIDIQQNANTIVISSLGATPSFGNTTAVTDDYTVLSTDGTVLVDCSVEDKDIALTLPDATTVPDKEIKFKQIDSSEKKVTISPADGQTIDGAASLEIDGSVILKAVGSGWYAF